MKTNGKLLIVLLFTFVGCLLFPVAAMAVSGLCSSCHTMHNYQDGAALAANTGGPHGVLLTQGGCVGCHTGFNTDASVALGAATDAPYVLSTSAPTLENTALNTALAGGDFYWVDDDGANSGDEYGHNVVGINGVDGTIGLEPPGWSNNAAFQTNGARHSGDASWATGQLTCDGVNGCHGDVTNGVAGSHHNNENGAVDLNNTDNHQGDHFRFLEGIDGYEDANWEFKMSAATTSHNKYQGEVRTNDDTSGTNNMSYFCAECHGDFHGDEGGAGLESVDGSMASPWIRHPVDILMPNSGEYTAYTDYDYVVPMAYAVTTAAPDAASDADVENTGIITCISCHYAHGSKYPDLMRWDYNGDVEANGGYTTNDANDVGQGCFKCHSLKDA